MEIFRKKIKIFKKGVGEEYQVAGNFIHPWSIPHLSDVLRMFQLICSEVNFTENKILTQNLTETNGGIQQFIHLSPFTSRRTARKSRNINQQE